MLENGSSAANTAVISHHTKRLDAGKAPLGALINAIKSTLTIPLFTWYALHQGTGLSTSSLYTILPSLATWAGALRFSYPVERNQIGDRMQPQFNLEWIDEEESITEENAKSNTLYFFINDYDSLIVLSYKILLNNKLHTHILKESDIQTLNTVLQIIKKITERKELNAANHPWKNTLDLNKKNRKTLHTLIESHRQSYLATVPDNEKTATLYSPALREDKVIEPGDVLDWKFARQILLGTAPGAICSAALLGMTKGSSNSVASIALDFVLACANLYQNVLSTGAQAFPAYADAYYEQHGSRLAPLSQQPIFNKVLDSRLLSLYRELAPIIQGSLNAWSCYQLKERASSHPVAQGAITLFAALILVSGISIENIYTCFVINKQLEADSKSLPIDSWFSRFPSEDTPAYLSYPSYIMGEILTCREITTPRYTSPAVNAAGLLFINAMGTIALFIDPIETYLSCRKTDCYQSDKGFIIGAMAGKNAPSPEVSNYIFWTIVLAVSIGAAISALSKFPNTKAFLSEKQKNAKALSCWGALGRINEQGLNQEQVQETQSPMQENNQTNKV